MGAEGEPYLCAGFQVILWRWLVSLGQVTLFLVLTARSQLPSVNLHGMTIKERIIHVFAFFCEFIAQQTANNNFLNYSASVKMQRCCGLKIKIHGTLIEQMQSLWGGTPSCGACYRFKTYLISISDRPWAWAIRPRARRSKNPNQVQT